MSVDNRGRRLRVALNERRAVLVPGAANALTARIIEDLGFEAVYVTGAGIANTNFGVPDVGLVTMTEVVDVVVAIADACSAPLIVDADTGFGNPLNVIRAVRSLERAGANALQLEDQIFPKRCGHFSGKGVVSADDMVMKIKAAVDTRRSADLLIIARTDARAIEGLAGAIDRAQRYAEAGADATFVEAPTSTDELRTIAASLAAPQIANMVVGGQTPLLSAAALREMGFAVVLYANTALQAAIQAMRDVLGALHEDGTLARVQDRLASFESRQQTVNKAAWDQLDDKYRTVEP
jgi:2-methylisocitrate lyase-like PEP mutase family enzyme